MKKEKNGSERVRERERGEEERERCSKERGVVECDSEERRGRSVICSVCIFCSINEIKSLLK